VKTRFIIAGVGETRFHRFHPVNRRRPSLVRLEIGLTSHNHTLSQALGGVRCWSGVGRVLGVGCWVAGVGWVLGGCWAGAYAIAQNRPFRV
jgi:hypothetical protein